MKDCINKALIAGTCAALLCAASGGAPGRIRDGKPFVHPGITYTQGDIDRMRSMIAAGRQPWKRCFDALRNAQTSNPWQGVRTRGGTIPQGQHNNTIGWDGRCAHDLALMWRLSDDKRYADTAVRILNENAKWESSSGAGTGPLDNGKIFLLVEAAELMRDYPGWADEDRAKFGETLRNVFYRHIRSGDSSRWGNQGLTAFRGTLAMAIFLDDAKMYDRVWNYLNGLDRRPDDDDPFPSGPMTLPAWPADYGEFCVSRTGTITRGNIPDWGFDEMLQYYIYRNGQCEESCRDQSHCIFGLFTYVAIAEMFWSQGDDLYGALDNRILTGLEWNLRYNMSDWEPKGYSDEETDATFRNGVFYRNRTRSGRWQGVGVSPWGRGTPGGAIPLSCAFVHYKTRLGVSPDKCEWLQKDWEVVHSRGGYENWGFSGHHYEWTGWGSLTKMRGDWMRGDPCTWKNGVRVSGQHQMPCVVKASDWDFYPGAGDRTAHHAVADRWSAGDWALYTVGGSGETSWRNVVITYESNGDAVVEVGVDDGELATVQLPSAGGGRREISAGSTAFPAGASVFKFRVKSCGSSFKPVAFGLGAALRPETVAAVPGVDFNGGTVEVSLDGLLVDASDAITGRLVVGGRTFTGSVDTAAELVRFTVDPSVARSGATLYGELTVNVSGTEYRRSVALVQGRAEFTTTDGWIREGAGGTGATGAWSATPVLRHGRLVVEDGTVFTPSVAMPEGDVAVIELKASLNAVDSADFGSDAKAGVAVVRVGGVCRYAFKTADGVVVDGTKVAPASSESSVRITADFGKSKVVYDVDGAEFGPFALNSSVKRLSSVAFKGLNFVEEMKGDYESVAADTYLAEVGGVKFTSLASALASKAAGVVKLLWDASWNPTESCVRSFETDGRSLVVGGNSAFRVKDSGSGVLTVTVLGAEDAPRAVSVSADSSKVRIGAGNVRPGFDYGLERADSPAGAFRPDAGTWRDGGVLAAGGLLELAQKSSASKEFYRIVVRGDAPGAWSAAQP